MRGTIIKRGDSFRIRVSLGKDPDTGKYTSYYETFRGKELPENITIHLFLLPLEAKERLIAELDKKLKGLQAL